MEFDIEGAEMEEGLLPTKVREALAVMEELPDGKLLTMRRIAQRLGIRKQTWQQYAGDPALEEYRASARMVGRNEMIRVYGNKRTIEALQARDAAGNGGERSGKSGGK